MRTRGAGWASIFTLLTLLVLTGLGTWGTHQEVSNQEDRLLRERANEVGLILTSVVTSLSGQMDVLGGVLRSTDSSRAAFDRAGEAIVSTTTDQAGLAVMTKTDSGFTVQMAVGTGLRHGQQIGGQRGQAIEQALTSSELVPTGIFGSGADRSIGFAIGPPTAPPGAVLYRQDRLGPPRPPSGANTAPFAELKVALYAGAPTAQQALVTTTPDVPLTGRVKTLPLAIGNTTWTLQVAADHPLVGSAAAIGQWIVLGGGIVVSFLVAIVVATESRRRRSALALYDSEHRIAETLQRSLLPHPPQLESITIATRYVAGGGPGQQVGGDWFDIFALGGDRIGIVIGDVAGHDVSAAAVMAQVQAALRAYATEGPEPAALLSRLDLHLTNSQIDRLVTVFYGILHPPGDDGRRRLRYANAGHLPPLVRHADGWVEELDGAGSLLLGAPVITVDRPHADVELRPGATLLLFTDGLVEVPRQSLTQRLVRLRTAVAATPTGMGPDELCEHVLDEMQASRRRDDVAVLAVQLTQVTVAEASVVERAET